MRPAIPKGEIFAAAEGVVESDGKPKAVITYFVAVEATPAGSPFIVARKLAMTRCDNGESELSLDESDTTPHPVLSLTAFAFFGCRFSPKDRTAAAEEECPLVTLLKTEADATETLLNSGRCAPQQKMRQVPLGDSVHRAEMLPASSEPVDGIGAANKAVLELPPRSREIRLSSQLKEQVHALLTKDMFLLRSSKKGLCAECCFPFIMIIAVVVLIVTMLLLPTKAASYSSCLSTGCSMTDLSEKQTCESAFPQLYEPGDQCVEDPTSPLFNNTFGPNCTNTRGASLCQASSSVMDVLKTMHKENPYNFVVGFDQPSQSLVNMYIAITNWYDFRWFLCELGDAYVATSTGNAVVEDMLISTGYTNFIGINQRSFVGGIGAVILIIGMIPALTRTATRLVDEKREGFREHLRVMGCGDGAYMLTTFLSATIRTLPILIGIPILCSALWWDSLDSFMIYCTIQLYMFAMTSLCFLMPSLFDSSTWTLVIMILGSLGTVGSMPLVTVAPASVQWLLALLVPTCNSWYGLAHAMSRKTFELEVSFGASIGIAIGQTFVFGLLGQYFYRVFPGKYGTPAHPCFFAMPLVRLLTCSRKRDGYNDIDEQNSAYLLQNKSGYNTLGDQSSEFVIRLQNLQKKFSPDQEKPTVDLTLDIRRGEILSLLGHNGAGKTTTISMLTGILEPTWYSEATVQGLDLLTKMDLIRLNVGVCPQHDVLFPDLSGRQHLQLYARLRGIQISPNRLDELLMFLELPLDNTRVSEYSGGMKRRVSVASALVGEPSVVFLDEPTTGVDEVSRRKLWELLKIERSRGTTIIMTTHMMEEAEVLGDRIAIMSDGRLHSEGTAMDLKAKYGSGCYLEVAKGPKFDGAAALALIKRHVAKASVEMDSAAECTFFLPVEATGAYAALLSDFETSLHGIGGLSYGISMSTLEDVFVSIAEGTDKDDDETDNSEDEVVKAVQALHADPITALFDADDGNLSYPSKVVADVRTFFMKRCRADLYMRMELLLQIAIPVVLILVAFFAAYAPADCDRENAQATSSASHSGYDYTDVTIPIFAIEGNECKWQYNISTMSASTERFRDQFRSEFLRQFPEVTSLRTPIVNSATEHILSSWSVDRFFSYTKMGVVPSVWAAVTFYGKQFDINAASMDFIRTNSDFRRETKVYQAFMRAIAASGNTTHANPDAAVEVEPVSFGATPPPTPAPPNTTQAPVVEPVECQKFTWGTAYILIVAIMFQTFPVMIIINDELSRGVLDTLQAHGATLLGYWIGNFLHDAVLTLILPIGLLIGVSAAGIDQFTETSGQMAGLFFTGLMYAVTMLLFTYALLVLTKTSKLNLQLFANLGLTMAFLIIPTILIMALETAIDLKHPWAPIFHSMTPTYAFYSIINFKPSFTRYRKPSGAVPLITLFLWPLVPIAIIALRLRRRTVRNQYVPATDGIPLDMFVDEDVISEMRRIDAQCGNADGRSDCLVAGNHIWMNYGDGKVAVKGVTFGVNPGECFGLLGTNGAGKTTTMRMMQLEMDPSGGNVTFGQLSGDYSASVDVFRQQVRQGVCQQHDTLIGALSGEEQLELYLRLRLGPRFVKSQWDGYIREVLRVVQLPMVKRSGAFSGGMKRKLAVALAVFTGARIVYLDEPSTGLDPFARRLLWKLITASLSPERAVLLTTHSMEEADAVCSRISIVTDGTMKCIGSSQHLKQRFGSGYVAHLMLSESSNPAQIDEAMKRMFGDACKPTRSAGQLRQYPIGTVTSLSATYRTLEDMTGVWGLERFSVSQPTLQQVYVTFAQNLHQSA